MPNICSHGNCFTSALKFERRIICYLEWIIFPFSLVFIFSFFSLLVSVATCPEQEKSHEFWTPVLYLNFCILCCEEQPLKGLRFLPCCLLKDAIKLHTLIEGRRATTSKMCSFTFFKADFGNH